MYLENFSNVLTLWRRHNKRRSKGSRYCSWQAFKYLDNLRVCIQVRVISNCSAYIYSQNSKALYLQLSIWFMCFVRFYLIFPELFKHCVKHCDWGKLHGIVLAHAIHGSHENGITIIRPVCPAIYLPILPFCLCAFVIVVVLVIFIVNVFAYLRRPHKYHVKSNNNNNRNRWSVEQEKHNNKMNNRSFFLLLDSFFTVVFALLLFSCFFRLC